MLFKVDASKRLTVIVLMIFSMSYLGMTSAGEENKKQIIKYKKYEKYDMGSLSVEGKILAPGDITVDEEKLDSSVSVYKRKRFSDKFREEIKGIE